MLTRLRSIGEWECRARVVKITLADEVKLLDNFAPQQQLRTERIILSMKSLKSEAVVLFLALMGLWGCAKKATEDQCRAGIRRMMEIQVDEMTTALAAKGQLADPSTGEHLKAGIPSIITPDAVAQCVERMKPENLECTMTATSTDELIEKCHWKVLPGGKLGF